MSRTAIRPSSLHTTRPPMSEARRQHVHGRLLPMQPEGELVERPVFRLRELVCVALACPVVWAIYTLAVALFP